MSASSDEEELIKIGEIPPEKVHLVRIGEVPQIEREDQPAYDDNGDRRVVFPELADEPFPNLLPPEGKSSAEAEAEFLPDHIRTPGGLDCLRERLQKPKPPAEPIIPRFGLIDVFILSTALAVGLAIGRIDATGFLALLLGFAATIAIGRTLLFGETDRRWVMAALAVVMVYLGASLGTAALRWFTGASLPVTK